MQRWSVLKRLSEQSVICRSFARYLEVYRASFNGIAFLETSQLVRHTNTMITRTLALAGLYASTVLGVCTKLEDCPEYETLKTSDCQQFHHFLIRGSTSPYPGHVISTVAKVCDQLNTESTPHTCGYEDIEYAAMNGGGWCESAHEGAVNGAAQMRNYTERCPDSHLILMGFSQGGSVGLDIVGGGGGELWGCMQESNPGMDISTAPGSKSAQDHFH